MHFLATAQVRTDTPSLIDVKGLGRPKGFTGREEDFQQWSKKTEAFFAGVMKQSEMMLEWAAEQATGVCVAADAHSTHGSHEFWGERHRRQPAEESVCGMAETAEAI